MLAVSAQGAAGQSVCSLNLIAVMKPKLRLFHKRRTLFHYKVSPSVLCPGFFIITCSDGFFFTVTDCFKT